MLYPYLIVKFPGILGVPDKLVQFSDDPLCIWVCGCVCVPV